jgi:hypothetical protein
MLLDANITGTTFDSLDQGDLFAFAMVGKRRLAIKALLDGAKPAARSDSDMARPSHEPRFPKGIFEGGPGTPSCGEILGFGIEAIKQPE